MTHRTNAPPNEKQKVMHGMLSRPNRWWKASELQEEFNLSEGTVRSALSEFKKKLKIVEHDKPHYRIIPGREFEARVYVKYGWDGFKTETRSNVGDPPEIKSEIQDQQINLDQYR